jgi:hypothetical protein
VEPPPPWPDSGSKACVKNIVAERRGLNLYLLVDASPSIVLQPLWDKLTLGISHFVEDTTHDGLGVGIGYYGISCTAADYTRPTVGVAPLPGVATAIRASYPLPLNGKASGAALSGAVSYARSIQKNDPYRDTAVVLMSDGILDPLCGSDATTAQNQARIGLLGDPPVRTHVVALGAGPTLLDPLNVVDLSPMDDVAAAGGTTSATRIYVSDEADLEIARGLDVAAAKALPCAYRIPPGVNRSRISFFWQAEASAVPAAWPAVASVDACKDGESVFVSSASSDYVELCPAACSEMRAAPAGLFHVVEDCSPL